MPPLPPSGPLRFAPALEARIAEENCHIIVTGAGGWFGNATLEMLDYALGPQFDSRVSAFASSAREHVLRSGRRCALRPLSSLSDLARPQSALYLSHYAFLTRERVNEVGEDVYVATNRALTTLMEAQGRRLAVSGTFSTSSGAVYGKHRLLDSNLANNPYGTLKLEEEAAFQRLRDDYGARTAVCRVFNVAGPFLNKEYALGSLIQAALAMPELTVRARHRVFRSYAHIADIISVGFSVMIGSAFAPDAPYDTSGEVAVEVGDLAKRVRMLLGCHEKPIVRGAIVEGSDDSYVGDRVAFEALARSAGLSLKSLDDQIMDTASYLAAPGGPGSV